MFYEKAAGSNASGSLIRPGTESTAGTGKTRVMPRWVLRLRMAGFYELIPGQAGPPVSE